MSSHRYHPRANHLLSQLVPPLGNLQVFQQISPPENQLANRLGNRQPHRHGNQHDSRRSSQHDSRRPGRHDSHQDTLLVLRLKLRQCQRASQHASLLGSHLRNQLGNHRVNPPANPPPSRHTSQLPNPRDSLPRNRHHNQRHHQVLYLRLDRLLIFQVLYQLRNLPRSLLVLHRL